MKVFIKMSVFAFLVTVCVAIVPGSRSSATSKPNFVIIMTDDQDVVLNGLLPMKKTQELLSQEGVTFANAVNVR